MKNIDWLRICPDCDGSGNLGKANDGRFISCENCGGHEDSLGDGVVFIDDSVGKLAKAIAQAVEKVEL